MQDVREIWFVHYDDEDNDSPTSNKLTPEKEKCYQEAFKKIEKMLEDYLDITPEVARITHNGCELVVTLDTSSVQDFTLEHALMVLKKLEELFHVTYLEMDSEYDDWYETDPHVLYGFYEKK